MSTLVCLHEHTSQTPHVQVAREQASAHQPLAAATVLTMSAPSKAAAGGLRADIRQPGAGILQRYPRLPYLPPVPVSFKLPPLQRSLAICLHLSTLVPVSFRPLRSVRWAFACACPTFHLHRLHKMGLLFSGRCWLCGWRAGC